MKCKFYSFFLLGFIFVPHFSYAIDDSDRNQIVAETQKAMFSNKWEGLEPQPPKSVVLGMWLTMSQKEKADFLLSAMKELQDHGVPFTESPEKYMSLIDERADRATELTSDVKNVLASIVYTREPASRDAIDRLRVKPKVQKIEMH